MLHDHFILLTLKFIYFNYDRFVNAEVDGNAEVVFMCECASVPVRSGAAPRIGMSGAPRLCPPAGRRVRDDLDVPIPTLPGIIGAGKTSLISHAHRS